MCRGVTAAVCPNDSEASSTIPSLFSGTYSGLASPIRSIPVGSVKPNFLK